ncbi:hypothetical protein HMPREF9162_0479 [Selenomonas sp. oral taxon 137 str. F0430]|nr:hypothetical protein [Selenomonas sp. oral taxon 137]EFR40000.1 hypothetical protein HMPREF9162_0479 [Selenomonas sp. oral taxon 137 str. F0430]
MNGIRLCNSLWTDDTAANAGFQYRKRYSPVQPLFDFDEANIS